MKTCTYDPLYWLQSTTGTKVGRYISTFQSGSHPDEYNVDYFTYSDHLGSSTLLFRTNGEIISREFYTPFGETAYRTSPKSRYRYCGKEKDGESGLYYYGARYYTAWLCRFVSVDPMAEKYAGISAYCYCFNSPINLTDPDGRDPAPDQGTAKGDGATYTGKVFDRNNKEIITVHGVTNSYLTSHNYQPIIGDESEMPKFIGKTNNHIAKVDNTYAQTGSKQFTKIPKKDQEGGYVLRSESGGSSGGGLMITARFTEVINDLIGMIGAWASGAPALLESFTRVLEIFNAQIVEYLDPLMKKFDKWLDKNFPSSPSDTLGNPNSPNSSPTDTLDIPIPKDHRHVKQDTLKPEKPPIMYTYSEPLGGDSLRLYTIFGKDSTVSTRKVSNGVSTSSTPQKMSSLQKTKYERFKR